ncbi:MAG: PorP/SprF family type IX secretion system membrane protein [Bacteroidia bacterium]
MKNTFTLCFWLFAAITTKAQLLPFMTHHEANSFLVNPAIPAIHRIVNPGTGSFEYRQTAALTYRDQWWALGEYRPRTYTATYQRYFQPRGRGVDFWAGGYLFADQVGTTHLSGAYTTFSAHRDLGYDQHLYAGLSLGLAQFAIRNALLTTTEPGDLTLAGSDRTEYYLDPGLGVFYTNQVYYAGFSMPKIIGLSVNGTRERLNHYYFLFGTTLSKPIGPFRSVEPYLWLRMIRNAAAQMDMNVRVTFRSRIPFWVTLGVDNTVAIHGNVGIITPLQQGKGDLKIGVGYDNRVTLASQLGGAVEVSVAWLMR